MKCLTSSQLVIKLCNKQIRTNVNYLRVSNAVGADFNPPNVAQKIFTRIKMKIALKSPLLI